MKRTAFERVGLLLGVVWLAAGAAHGQVCPAEGDGRRRALAVSVLDEAGNLVRGLTAADFRGEFRGQPVKVLSVTRGFGSRRIIVLLDVSDSVTDQKSRWEMARTAAGDVVSYAPPGSLFALYFLGTQVELKEKLTSAREPLLERLARLGSEYRAPKGNRLTALLDAVAEGLEALETPQLGDSFFLATDGTDNRSRTKRREVEERMQAGGVRMFAFVLRSRLEVPGPFLSPDDLVKMTKETGGGAVSLYSQSRFEERYRLDEQTRIEVATLLRRLYRAIGDFYRVEVELAREVDKRRGWKLEVVEPPGSKRPGRRRKGVEVIYPRKLVPCARGEELKP